MVDVRRDRSEKIYETILTVFHDSLPNTPRKKNRLSRSQDKWKDNGLCEKGTLIGQPRIYRLIYVILYF